MPSASHTISPPPRQPSVPIPQPQTYAAPPGAPPAQSYDYYSANSGYGGNVLPEPGSTAAAAAHQPERSYTLGGGGYGGNVVPDTTFLDSRRAYTSSPPAALQPAVNTNYAAPSGPTSPMGPRSQGQSHAYGGMPSHQTQEYEDSPPDYEVGTSQAPPTGGWDSKQPR